VNKSEFNTNCLKSQQINADKLGICKKNLPKKPYGQANKKVALSVLGENNTLTLFCDPKTPLQ